MKLFQIIYIALILSLGFAGCKDTQPMDDIPRVYVYEQINLNDFRYNALNLVGGFAYIPGGVRGIILYRKSSNQYLAFERDCPYQPLDSCALVSVDSSTLFMIDTCCSSEFDFDGNPIAGPARFPMLQYSIYKNGNFLTISSE